MEQEWTILREWPRFKPTVPAAPLLSGNSLRSSRCQSTPHSQVTSMGGPPGKGTVRMRGGGEHGAAGPIRGNLVHGQMIPKTKGREVWSQKPVHSPRQKPLRVGLRGDLSLAQLACCEFQTRA